MSLNGARNLGAGSPNATSRAARAGWWSAALTLLTLLSSGCGYSLAGRGAFLPDYIRTIGVPNFVNQSTLPDADRILGDAVRAEFQGRGRYRVISESTGVDAVLNATIASVVSAPVAFTPDRQVSSVAIIVTANVEFRDEHASGKVLWSNPALQFREEYPVTTGSTANDPAAFFGGNANALDRLAKNFARSVVTAILEAF